MRALILGSALTLAALPAFAGILSSSGTIEVGGSTLCNSSLSTPAELLNTCGNGSSSAITKAQSDYGVLKAYAQFTANSEPSLSINALSTASFTDFIHLTSSGAPATIDFVFTVTGAGFSGADASMSLNVSSSTAGGPPFFAPLVQTGGAGTYTYTTNYSPLLPADDFTLILFGTLQARAAFTSGSPNWSGAATSDFFSTATLSSVIVYDAGHNDISNTVSISGGAPSYNLGGGGGEVPEPSTVLLTAAGAAVAFFFRKRSHA